MSIKINWDGLGIFTSVLCAIHCALLPLALTSLPVFGVNILHNAVFEWGMILLAYAVGSYSLFHGYVKHHRSWQPVLIFSAGAVFLAAKQFFPEAEIPLLLIAVGLIITAHYLNYRLCHKTRCQSPHHSHG